MSTENKMSECVDPHAPVYMCAVCHAPVFTCERKEAENNSYLCPVHPDGIETKHGLWLCSDECCVIYNDVLSPSNLTESQKKILARIERINAEDAYLARLDSSLLRCQDRFLNLAFIMIAVGIIYSMTFFVWSLL